MTAPRTEAIDSWEGLDAWVTRIVAARQVEVYRSAPDAAFCIWEAYLAAGLRRIQERGELDPEADPHRLAASLVAALRGGCLLASVHGRVGIIHDVLDDAVAALRRYQV